MQPFWRPNFNIPSTLPDIKVVRTDFIVNFIAVSLALMASFYVAKREYRAYTLSNTIEELRQDISVAEPDDKLNLAMSERFREASRHIVELEKFYESPMRVHELMAQLAELRPEGLIFQIVTLSENVAKKGTKSFVEYSINISGDVKDPVLLGDFKARLQASELFAQSDYESEIDESLRSRDAKTGIFPYRLMIVLREANAAKTGKKKGAEG